MRTQCRGGERLAGLPCWALLVSRALPVVRSLLQQPLPPNFALGVFKSNATAVGEEVVGGVAVENGTAVSRSAGRLRAAAHRLAGGREVQQWPVGLSLIHI